MESKEVKTESKSLHTKGFFRQGYANTKAIVCEFDGLIITVANTETGSKLISDEIAIANAERICTCLNAHDELVENLARLIDRIEESDLQSAFPSAYNRAKEALKKATV